MRRKPRVALDCDDVLNDFTLTALRSVGCDVLSHRDYPVAAGWGLADAAKQLGWKGGDFWGEINYRGWWKGVRKSDDFARLNAVLERADVFLITSNKHLSSEMVAGKLDWIQDNLPERLRRSVVLCHEKEIHADPDTLLIDDAQHNVDAWRERGGKAALMPRPWNSNRDYQYYSPDRRVHTAHPANPVFWAKIQRHIQGYYDDGIG